MLRVDFVFVMLAHVCVSRHKQRCIQNRLYQVGLYRSVQHVASCPVFSQVHIMAGIPLLQWDAGRLHHLPPTLLLGETSLAVPPWLVGVSCCAARLGLFLSAPCWWV